MNTLFSQTPHKIFRYNVCVHSYWKDLAQKVSDYDQEMSQSHTADQPTALLGRGTED